MSVDYWRDCIGEAAEECNLALTDSQLDCLANAAKMGHECYGLAFYSPPASDRISAIRAEMEAKLKRLQSEFDAYRENAETAVKKALNQYTDAQISIHEYGEVLRHDGRTERIQ